MKQRVILCVLFLLSCGSILVCEAQPTGRAGDTSLLEDDFTILGEKVKYLAGASIATGDINGDGLGDLIYGVPWAMPNNQYQFAGEVHVFFGHKNRTLGGQATKNIIGWPNYTSIPDVTISGENPGDKLGTSGSTGDVNGDGIQDLIMGAGGYSTATRSTAGSVFVIFGKTNWPTFYVLRAQRADIQVIGAHFTDKLGGHKTHVPATDTGQTVGAGDINGDGIDDLIMGAPDATFTQSSLPKRSLAGACYVLWGQKNWQPQYVHDLLTTQASVTVYSSLVSAHLGGAVDVGDINGDGIGDLIIGEPEGLAPGGSGGGNTYVFNGRTNWPANAVIDLGLGTKADITIMGHNQWDQSGYSLDVGDFNNDTIDDLILGAWRHDAKGRTRNNSGKVYVFYGNKAFPPNHQIDLKLTLGDLNFIGTGNETWLGYRVRAGDVDGDGIDDMIMSSPGETPSNFKSQAGITYVYRGGQTKPPFFLIDWQTFYSDWRIWGGNADECLGQTLEVGDINGDKVADIIQGADLTVFNSNTTERGKVVVTYGGPLFATAAAKVNTTMTFKILSPADGNRFFIAAASFGLGNNAGIPIAPGRVIPIDADVLTVLSAFNINPFAGFQGFLDGSGVSTTPSLAIPNFPVLVGNNLFFTVLIQDPAAPQGIKTIGNRVHSTITP